MALGRVSSPWLMLPPSFGGGGLSYNFYSLAENRVVSLKKKSIHGSESPKDDAEIVGSSHGWLALYNRRDNSLFLSNPVSGENIKLPPLSTCCMSEYCAVITVILSSPPHRQDCRAIISISFDRGSFLDLAVCSPGRSSAWTHIPRSEDHEDIVYSTKHRRLISLLLEEDATSYYVEAWDCTNPQEIYDRTIYLDSPRSGRSDRELFALYGSWPRRHLVEHTDQLLLVKRHLVKHVLPDGSLIKNFWNDQLEYPHKTVAFDVYVINTSMKRLRYMEGSLDGLSLFVGLNHSFALRAADYPELKPDSIYFTEAKPFDWPVSCPDYKYGGHDIGIFDYKNKTISPCYFPCDHRSFKKIYPSPVWFTPSPH